MHICKVTGLLVLVATSACTAPADDRSLSAGPSQDAVSIAQASLSVGAGSHSSAKDVSGAENGTSEKGLRSSYLDCAASNDGSTWDMQACVEIEFDYQDERLNMAYRRIMSRLSGAEKEAMKGEQRRWIVERDSLCSWDAATEGQGQRLEANICALERTAKMASELERKLLGDGPDKS